MITKDLPKLEFDDIRIDLPEDVPESLKTLLRGMTYKDPVNRYSISKIKETTWWNMYKQTRNVSGQRMSEDINAENAIQQINDTAPLPNLVPGAPVLNAFKLINLWGGMDLNYLFHQKTEQTAHRFMSFKPCEEIIRHLIVALNSMRMIIHPTVNEINAKRYENNELISFLVSVVQMSGSGVHVVEFRLRVGNPQEFDILFDEILSKTRVIRHINPKP
eukprot:c20756_g1_i2.p1 GENE.c20756_g1_i2~~c20756_g1_i2.p1  ORF type:complete len:218 (+),score=64.41 c20756_g1_i2:311-964(+)